MGNIRRLFVNDVKRLGTNVVTTLIVLGLVLLPSIFSWYNILACWDVFNNTDNLTVAVASDDVGYESDLVPLRVNLGEQVVSQLRADNEMNWVFTDSDDAVEGVKSGKYYAAVVIPESFSQDMMTFYSDDVEHAKIVYYSNEKKNVVAPKLTDQGADQVSNRVNEIFTQELSDTALSVASSLADYADEAGAESTIGDVASHVDALAAQMRQGASVLDSYASVLQASESLVTGSADLLAQAGESADSVLAAADEGKQAVGSIGDALSSSNEALGEALSQTAASFEGVTESADEAFSSSNQLAGTTSSALRNQATSLQSQIDSANNLIAQLQTLKASVPDEYQDTIQSLIDRMQATVESQKTLQQSMRDAADAVESGNADAQAQHAEVKQLAEQAQQSVSDLSQDYNNTIKPNLEQLASQISEMSSDLSNSASSLSSVGDTMDGTADSLVANMEASREKLGQASTELSDAADKFSQLASDIRAALASEDVDMLREVLGSDVDALSDVLAAPVALERNAVFPAENFGSQMAPLYSTLGLWIGSLLMVVGLRVSVSRQQRDELPGWKLYQLFLGRFGVFALLSLAQSTTMALGNMLFLGVQVNEPALYLACFWLSGLVFVFICYTLVVSFANLGKAIAVFLLIIQVTSGGGSFPLQMLPDFFQVLSPFLPATHVINAMRAAMMGVYEYDFFIQMGQLLAFVVPFLLLGLALRKPLMKLLNWYVHKTEESKLVN